MSLKLTSNEARENVKRHRFVRFLAGAAVLVVSVFVVYTIISNNIKISEQTDMYNELVSQTEQVKEANEQINGYLEDEKNLEAYIEEVARKRLGYADPSERIYIVVPGK